MQFVAQLLMKTFNLIKFRLFLRIPSPHSIVTNCSTFSLSFSLTHTHTQGQLPSNSLRSQCHGYFSDYQEGVCKLHCQVPFSWGLSVSFQNLKSEMSQSQVLLPHSDSSAHQPCWQQLTYILPVPKFNYKYLC